MDEHSENINKEGSNMRKYQIEVAELKDTISGLKNTLEGSRINKMKQKKGSLNMINELHSYQWFTAVNHWKNQVNIV